MIIRQSVDAIELADVASCLSVRISRPKPSQRRAVVSRAQCLVSGDVDALEDEMARPARERKQAPAGMETPICARSFVGNPIRTRIAIVTIDPVLRRAKIVWIGPVGGLRQVGQ